ncbi:MAG TPA: adenylosuccinate lyase family protein [Candidatus Acidoferrales bacterium]|nr:adenylosuccinate lyase family protein [Candidatus Acidoferrales bacterium]
MGTSPIDSRIVGNLYGTAEMRTVFSDVAWVQRMLDVEAALARAQARLGLVPHEVADAITDAAQIANIDLDGLAASTNRVGYPVVSLVGQLGAAAGEEAARYVHLGATTQDILDSALVLQMRDGLELIEHDLIATARALVARAREHRETVMAGRTHLQHAVPVTFGYKCALWAAPLLDHVTEIRAAYRALPVQFGGAAGTLASLGNRGRAVCIELGAELNLRVPDAPWHSSRSTIAHVAALLGIICGSLAKFATDIVLLMQTEVAEVFEPYERGRGSSSTMPQKRNPIASEYILACARGVHARVAVALAALAGDHERSTGPWQSEPLAVPEIFVLSAGAVQHARTIAEGLTIDAERMRENLARGGGLILAEAVAAALTAPLGRDAAHHAVERACHVALEAKVSFADALFNDDLVRRHVGRDELERLFDPRSYLGDSGGVVDRVSAAAEAILPPP